MKRSTERTAVINLKSGSKSSTKFNFQLKTDSYTKFAKSYVHFPISGLINTFLAHK